MNFSLEVKKEVNDWWMLKDMCWSGAIPVLEEIEKQNKEDEALDIIRETFMGEIPTETEVNDFIWFELYDIMELDKEEEEEEEE